MNSDIYAFSVPSQCKAKEFKISDCKHADCIKPSLEKIKVYARGWLNYCGIASMKNNIDDINGWLYHRQRPNHSFVIADIPILSATVCYCCRIVFWDSQLD